MDLDFEETAIKGHPFPNAVSPAVIRIPPTKAATTVLTASTTEQTPVPVPSKPSITISGGEKRINYNYHPIIDYFRTQQSKSFEHGNNQDWTPIVGKAEKPTK